MATLKVNDENFDKEVLKSTKPIVVDFWAEWCGPCKMVGPILEEISDEMVNEITIAKHNIDEEPNTPTKYGVRGIPTMLLFKDGELKSTKVADEAIYDCLQFLGGYGYMEEYPLARLLRDSRLGPIGGGTSEILREIIAKMVIDGKDYKPATK